MKLKLTVVVPKLDVDQDATLTELLRAAVSGQGITIITATGRKVDVDLTDVERVAPVSLAQEVTS